MVFCIARKFKLENVAYVRKLSISQLANIIQNDTLDFLVGVTWGYKINLVNECGTASLVGYFKNRAATGDLLQRLRCGGHRSSTSYKSTLRVQVGWRGVPPPSESAPAITRVRGPGLRENSAASTERGLTAALSLSFIRSTIVCCGNGLPAPAGRIPLPMFMNSRHLGSHWQRTSVHLLSRDRHHWCPTSQHFFSAVQQRTFMPSGIRCGVAPQWRKSLFIWGPFPPPGSVAL